MCLPYGINLVLLNYVIYYGLTTDSSSFTTTNTTSTTTDTTTQKNTIKEEPNEKEMGWYTVAKSKYQPLAMPTFYFIYVH